MSELPLKLSYVTNRVTLIAQTSEDFESKLFWL